MFFPSKARKYLNTFSCSELFDRKLKNELICDYERHIISFFYWVRPSEWSGVPYSVVALGWLYPGFSVRVKF